MSNSTTPAHIAASFAEWKPETHREKVLVQSIADTEWRLLRIPALESGIYALGRIQFADQFADQPNPSAPRSSMPLSFRTPAAT